MKRCSPTFYVSRKCSLNSIHWTDSTRIDENMEQLVPFYTGAVRMIQPLDNCLAVPYKVKHKSPLWSNNSTPGYLPKKRKSYVHKRLVHECFWQIYSKYLKTGSNPNVYQQANGLTDCDVFIQWDTTQQQREMTYRCMQKYVYELRKKPDAKSTYRMIHIYEVHEQTKLIYGDRNQSTGCFWRSGADWKET